LLFSTTPRNEVEGGRGGRNDGDEVTEHDEGDFFSNLLKVDANGGINAYNAGAWDWRRWVLPSEAQTARRHIGAPSNVCVEKGTWEELVMKRSIVTLVVAASAAVASGCAGTYPAPTQGMADTESAARSARELGAESKPQAKLHLKLADEQTAQAKEEVRQGDNKKAESTLLRAKADAELAIALTREQDANVELQKATEKSVAAGTAAANGAK